MVIRAVLPLSLLLTACATSYQAKIAEQPEGTVIGIIDWLPK